MSWIIPRLLLSIDMDLRSVSMASWLVLPSKDSPLTAISWSLTCRRPSWRSTHNHNIASLPFASCSCGLKKCFKSEEAKNIMTTGHKIKSQSLSSSTFLKKICSDPGSTWSILRIFSPQSDYKKHQTVFYSYCIGIDLKSKHRAVSVESKTIWAVQPLAQTMLSMASLKIAIFSPVTMETDVFCKEMTAALSIIAK